MPRQRPAVSLLGANRRSRDFRPAGEYRDVPGPKKPTGGRCLCIACHGLVCHGVTVLTHPVLPVRPRSAPRTATQSGLHPAATRRPRVALLAQLRRRRWPPRAVPSGLQRAATPRSWWACRSPPAPSGCPTEAVPRTAAVRRTGAGWPVPAARPAGVVAAQHRVRQGGGAARPAWAAQLVASVAAKRRARREGVARQPAP